MATYTREQIAAALRRAGFPAGSIPTWVAIVLAESSGRSDATNDTRNVDPEVLAARGHSPEYSLGPFQINMLAHRGRISEADARDLDRAAQFAFDLSGGGKDMRPWGAFTDGRYKQFVTGGSKNLAQPLPPKSGTPLPPWLGGEPEEEPEDAEGKPKLRVPSNLVPIIQAVSDETGVPFYVIAGVIQTQAGWSGSIVPELIVDVALKLKEQVTPGTADFARGEEVPWDLLARNVFGAGRDSWLRRYEANVYTTVTVRDDKGKTVKDAQGKAVTKKGQSSWIEIEPTQPRNESFRTPLLGGGVGGFKVQVGDGPKVNLADLNEVYDLFEALTGKRPASDVAAQKYVGLPVDAVRAALIATPEGAIWRTHGPQIRQARAWVDRLYITYTGREPDNATVRNLIERGYNPATLEQYLRVQPSGVGQTTLGQLTDARTLAHRKANDVLGRDADDGEIQFLLSNKVPINEEHFGAFFEQVKDKAVWGSDPKTFRDWRARLDHDWKRLGLSGPVPWEMVNRAQGERWGPEKITSEIGALPAPGYQQGVTVGQVERVRQIASRFKSAIIPGEEVTKEELDVLVGEHPEGIRRYYRSLPATPQAREREKPMGEKPPMRAASIAKTQENEPEKEPENISVGR